MEYGRFLPNPTLLPPQLAGLGEPSIVEMVKAQDMVSVGKKVKKDEEKRGWPLSTLVKC